MCDPYRREETFKDIAKIPNGRRFRSVIENAFLVYLRRKLPSPGMGRLSDRVAKGFDYLICVQV